MSKTCRAFLFRTTHSFFPVRLHRSLSTINLSVVLDEILRFEICISDELLRCAVSKVHLQPDLLLPIPSPSLPNLHYSAFTQPLFALFLLNSISSDPRASKMKVHFMEQEFYRSRILAPHRLCRFTFDITLLL